MNKLYWLFRKTLMVEISYSANNLLQFASLLFYVMVFYFLGGLINKAEFPALKIYGGDYFSFVLFGLALTSFYNVAQSAFASNLRNEQVLGTMEALLATGTGISTILAGFSVYDYLLVSGRVIVMFLLSIVFLHVHFVWSNLFPALLILVLSMMAFTGLGLISAAFVMIFKKGDPLGWLVGNLSTIAGGVYFPVEILPPWLQKFAAVLPITPALKAIRMVLLNGASLYQVRYELFQLVLFVVVLLPLGLISFNSSVKRATADGSIANH